MSPGLRLESDIDAPRGALVNTEQGSWLWHKKRDAFPTGSKAYDYCVKRRPTSKGGFPPHAIEAMEHGKKWEGYALARYAEKLRECTLKSGNMWIHRNVAASPDGITSDGVVVEVKCPYWREVKHGSMPIHDWWQVQAEMEATGLEEADYVQLPFHGDVIIMRVFKHPRVSAYMQEQFAKERVRRSMAKRIKID